MPIGRLDSPLRTPYFCGMTRTLFSLTVVAFTLASSVIVGYDARGSETTPVSSPVLGATNLRMHVLPAGSTFDPQTGKATLP